MNELVSQHAILPQDCGKDCPHFEHFMVNTEVVRPVHQFVF